MSNLEQQCNNILAQAQNMLLRDKWSNGYNAFIEAFTLADAHYKDAPLYKKIGTAVCYRVFKAYLHGAIGLIRMREGLFSEAIEQLTKGIALCPHDILLQRLVIANLQLGFISEAHRYLRMLHSPPITNDSIIFALDYNIHVPSSEIHSLEAILYIHIRNINKAIASCFTGMSLLAEEVKECRSGSLHGQTDSEGMESPRLHDVQQDSSVHQTAFQRRICVHCLSMCETMKMAAEIGLGIPYSVDGSIELVLESLFSNIPGGIVEGNRILDFSSLSSFAFMMFLDNNGDPTLPGRGVTLPEMLVNIFSMNFKCANDIFAVPLKITPFLSLSLFSDTIRAELATYSEAYKKAVIDHGVALLDRRYLIIKSSSLSRYIEKTYKMMHSSIPSLTNNLENISSGKIKSDTYSRKTADSRAGRRLPISSAAKVGTNSKQYVVRTMAHNRSARTITKNQSISCKNYSSSKSSQSIVSATHNCINNKNFTRGRVTSIKQVMDRLESGPTGSDASAVLPIVVKSTKEHREDLSFLPHSDIKLANAIKEIDSATQITLEEIDTITGAAETSPRIHNLYTDKISTCHECSYSTPTFATRKLRDDADREGVVNLSNQIKATNAFRDISLGGMYKSQLEKSMTGTLRERMFIELALEKVEKDSLEDFSFLKAENVHLINRNILFDGSIATSNLRVSKRKEKSTTLRDSTASPLAQSLNETRTRPERIISQTFHGRFTPSTVSIHSQMENLQHKPTTDSMLQNNDFTDVGSCYTDDQLSVESFAQGASVANYSVNESNYMIAYGSNQARTPIMSRRSTPLRSIPEKYIKKLVAKSSKKASISRNTAYQKLKKENRLGLELDDIYNKDSDEFDAEELARQRCSLYLLNTSNSPSPEVITTEDELINDTYPQIISTGAMRSETAALAESILTSKVVSITPVQPNNLLTGVSENQSTEYSIENKSNPSALKHPINYANSEDDILPSMPQPNNFSPDTRLSLKYARDDFHGSRTAGQKSAGTNTLTRNMIQADNGSMITAPAITVQPSENFGYLIDTLHIRDISGPVAPGTQTSTSVNTSTLINTDRLPYSDNLLMKVELDQSTRELNLVTRKNSENASFPTYKGTMHVSVRLGSASNANASNTHQSKSAEVAPKTITNYNLALVDDERPIIEEKDKAVGSFTDTMTLTSEFSDTTESPVSIKASLLNNLVVETQSLHPDPTDTNITDIHFEESTGGTGHDVSTLPVRSSEIPLNSLRTNIFSDISNGCACTTDIVSLVPTLETFPTAAYNTEYPTGLTLTSPSFITREYKTQSVPKAAKVKRKIVPLSTVLHTCTIDAAETRVTRMRSFNIPSTRPSIRSRKW